MKISKEEVIHIAKLACLNIPEDKIENYRKNLEEILDFAQIVNKVDTEGMKETVGVNESYNVFRKDEIIQTSSREELLQNAEEVQEGMFKIPKVIK